ncbi:class I SAM-dependent methyltransferase [Brevundimonas faecalis]|uniref:class I SAM-dependent methyltransferase n=1 Tax=Brevundimonas faecalis TaxID=947378 RepID=UPI003614B6BD
MADGTGVQNAECDPVDAIDGWLSESAKAFSEALLSRQRLALCQTGSLELGVHRGKFLAVLARGNDTGVVVGVDAMLDAEGRDLSPEHAAEAVEHIRRNVATASLAPVHLITARTATVTPEDLLGISSNGFSFIHIDAGHEAEDVRTDIALADAVLSTGGVIAMDDFLNVWMPGVTDGLYSYRAANPDTDIVPFAAGGNKLFLCRRADHDLYAAFATTQPHGARGRMMGCELTIF